MTGDVYNLDFMLAGAQQRHAGYGRLRAVSTDSVHRVTLLSGGTGYLITGYDTVRQALAEPRLQGRTGAVGDRRSLSPDVQVGMNTHMLNLNPPDHTRLRRLVSAAFTTRRMEQLRPRIQELTGTLLDAMADEHQVDLIEALALPLPIRVIGELLGVPIEDTPLFHAWTTTLTTSGLPLGELNAAAAEMLAYTRALLDSKRRQPGTDLLSALVAVRDGEDRLNDDELTSMVFLMLIAGHETTVNLISSATLALLTNPDQFALLRANPDMIAGAVEEFLRYESPVQAALRYSTEPLELGGVEIPANSVVLVSLLAANRDPNRFPGADQLDLHRTDNPQLAFGHGIHHCLGAPLARLEGKIAIAALIDRFPGMRLAVPEEKLSWRSSLVMHGLDGLPVILR